MNMKMGQRTVIAYPLDEADRFDIRKGRSVDFTDGIRKIVVAVGKEPSPMNYAYVINHGFTIYPVKVSDAEVDDVMTKNVARIVHFGDTDVWLMSQKMFDRAKKEYEEKNNHAN